MVLYHAITTYHILKCAVHKLIYHTNEEAIILLPKFLVRIPYGLKQSGCQNIFNHVLFFEWERKTSNDDLESIIRVIDNEIQEVFGVEVWNEIAEINVCRAAYMFGIYLCYKNISFQWFEEADGRLSNPFPIMKDDERVWPFRYELAMQYGLYTGDNPCVIKKMVNIKSQCEEFSDELAEDFNVTDMLRQIPEKSREKLLTFFNVPQTLHFKQHCALILTQHYTNMRVLSFEEHALCYQFTVDYFLDGYKIYYKWHPSDLMPYVEFMNDAEMISGDFPSELLTLVCDDKIDIVASISSSGVYNLSDMCERILTFNEEYISTFWYNHKYYFCAELMRIFPYYKFYAVGLNRVQLCNMVSFGLNIEKPLLEFNDDFNGLDLTAPTVWLIGKSETISKEILEGIFCNCKEEDVFVFLNFSKENYFIQFTDYCPVIVKTIKIRVIDEEEYGKRESREWIYIFTKSKEIRRCIAQMKFLKFLLNTGVEVSVDSDEDKDVRIKALEGMLKATEDELIKYRTENLELKERLQIK